MKNFNFKTQNLFSGPHLLGLLILLAGLLALASPLFIESGSSIERTMAVGIGAVVLGIIIVSCFSGTKIDFASNKYQAYTAILGFKIGEWSTLPQISMVKVLSKTYKATNTANGVSPTMSGKVTDFKVLVISSSQTALSFVYTNQEKALSDAKALASGFKTELVKPT